MMVLVQRAHGSRNHQASATSGAGSTACPTPQRFRFGGPIGSASGPAALACPASWRCGVSGEMGMQRACLAVLFDGLRAGEEPGVAPPNRLMARRAAALPVQVAAKPGDEKQGPSRRFGFEGRGILRPRTGKPPAIAKSSSIAITEAENILRTGRSGVSQPMNVSGTRRSPRGSPRPQRPDQAIPESWCNDSGIVLQ